MHHLLETWFHWVLTGGYVGIIVLMAMESSIFPVPSEIVIPPAAFLAAQGKLSFTGVVLAGVLGSYLGSAITYWASRLIGRPLIVKYGRFVLVTPKKTGASRAMALSLRGGRSLFRAPSSGGSPSDLDSSRDRSNEFRPFQSRDDCRIGGLVLDSGLSRR